MTTPSDEQVARDLRRLVSLQLIKRKSDADRTFRPQLLVEISSHFFCKFYGSGDCVGRIDNAKLTNSYRLFLWQLVGRTKRGGQMAATSAAGSDHFENGLDDAQDVCALLNDHMMSLRRVAQRAIVTFGLRVHLDPDDLINAVIVVLLQNPTCIDGLTPFQQSKYVEQMVRNEAINTLRRIHASKRGGGRTLYNLSVEQQRTLEARVSFETKFNETEFSELLEFVYSSLSAVERQLCMFRRAGYAWEEIGRLVSMRADTARKRYERAIGKALIALREEWI